MGDPKEDLAERNLDANTASQSQDNDAKEVKKVDAGNPAKFKTETMSKNDVDNVTLISEDGECVSKGVCLNFSDVVN